MLELGGDFGRVHLGGGPKGSGVYWVDDAGCWNKSDPNEPHSTDNQVFDHPLRNRKIAFGLMGMARVEISSLNSHVDVRWNVRRANLVTLDAVANFLDMFCTTYTVSLSFHMDAWNHERYNNTATAINRMRRLENYRGLLLIDKVFMKNVALGWNANMTSLIQSGVQALDVSDGDLTHSGIRALLPKMIVYKASERSNEMTIINAGHRSAYASIYGKSWSQTAVGTAYDSETPGVYFSNRVSQSYADVLRTGEPRLDHIRGIINRPDEEALWCCYQRLLFRGTWHDGSPVLVCLSDLTQDLDIPFFINDRHIN